MGCSFRKIISVLCVLALLLGMVPSAAFAAPDGTAAGRASEPVSVAAAESGEPAADRGGSFSPKTSEVSTWTGLQERINNASSGETITLSTDITAGSGDSALAIQNSSLTIDLNGHTINRNVGETARNIGCVIYVYLPSDSCVTIKDSAGGGAITGGNNTARGGGIFVHNGNLTLDNVTVTSNASEMDGGGICMMSGGTLTVSGCSITGNTAGDNGGGIYLDRSSLTVSDSSVTKNTAEKGGGIYSDGVVTFRFTGGSISGNTADTDYGNGICMNDYEDTLELSGPSAFSFTDDICLPAGKTITLNGAPTAGSSVHVTVQKVPTADSPVVIAAPKSGSTTDCSAWLDCLVIDNQPQGTELVCVDNQIILRIISITTWTDLQRRLTNAQEGDTITLTQNITAESGNNALVFDKNISVTLDLNGFDIDRHLSSEKTGGNVLTISSGSLTLRSSKAKQTGKITGGYNTESGGGVRVLGGNFTMEGGKITHNISEGFGGGGVFVTNGGSFTMEGGYMEANEAYKGGNVCASGGSFTMKGGRMSGGTANYGAGVCVTGGSAVIDMPYDSFYGIAMNRATVMGGGIYVDTNGKLTLKRGHLYYNTQGNDDSNGIYYRLGSLTLSQDNAADRIEVEDGIYMSGKMSLKITGTPAANTAVHMKVEATPTAGSPVVIAEQQTEGDYSAWLDCLVIDDQPEDTELAYEDNRIILRYRSGGVNSWAKLQTALNDGGVWDSEEQEYIIRLEDTIAAKAGDTALTFGYTGHNVVLDLCGHTIDRDLSEAAADGNVLTVNDGTLILRDSSAAKTGSITGGYNTAEGGGVRVLGGAFTVESGSITGNSAQNGGGVYANGSVTLEGGSITGNHAAENGGGIYNYMFSNETLYISGSVNVSDNTAEGNGGGIYLYGSGPLHMSGDVNVAGNTAGGNGGGIYMAGAFAFEMHNNSSFSGNTAGGNGGGIYMAIPTFKMHDNSSVTDNTANGKGDGIYADVSTQLHLNGGTVSHTQAGDASRVGIYLNDRTLLRLYGEHDDISVTDSIYLPKDKIIHISDTPAAGSSVHVRVGQSPTAAAPDVAVAEAESAEVCSAWLGCFTIDNQPDDTELVCVDEQIVLRKKSEEITTWAELQEALENGGSWEYSESGLIHIIRLTADITAEADNTALEFHDIGHDVILDLCGHTIDRNMSEAAADGNVLTVNDGTLILRDSAGEGKLTGGYNTAEGSGVRVLGGAFVMEGGSVTGNTIKDVNGGGVYLNGGTFKLKGGSITGNSAVDCLGAGVYMNGGSFVVSGSPTVTGNTDNTGTQNPSNVYLCAGCVISLDAALTEGASFGIGAGYEGRFTDDSYAAYQVDPFFTADSMYRLYQDTDGCPCIENVNHHPAEQPVWSWADDLTAATAKLVCQNCGETIWSEETGTVSFAYDAEAKKLFAGAEVNHDGTSYPGRLELHPLRVEERQPRIDENKVYHSGTKAHYKLTVVNAAYYFTETDDHPGEPCSPDDLKLDTFSFIQREDGSRGIEKYTGSFGESKTYIRLPARIENPEDPDDPTKIFALTFLGNGTDAFYTPTSADAPVEIMDYGTITHINAGAFAHRQNLTLKLRAFEQTVTIADGAFGDNANAKIMAYSTSGLTAGEHIDGTGKYTVAFVDAPSYTATADWAEDYSAATITITAQGLETHTFPAQVTRAETETEDPETHVKSVTLSFKAEGTYEGDGQTYSVELNEVPFFNVTVEGTEGTLRMPKARNAENTGYADHAVFTVKQDMLDRLSPPAGTVLAGLYDGSRIYGVGTRVEIRQDTGFTAGWRSVWAKVQAALNAGGEITLYSDIAPAEGDGYLHVPANVTATLNLGGYTINRGLGAAVNDGYVMRVDGSLTLNGNNGSVLGGNNTGNGGGIYVSGSLSANDVNITCNKAQGDGGGLYIGGESPVSNSGNLTAASPDIRLAYARIMYNCADNGGGVFVNTGKLNIGSGTEIINNTDLSGGSFKNIDVRNGEISILEGAIDYLLGLPALTASGISGLPAWAEILITGGVIGLAVFLFDRLKSGDGDDQKKECTHPKEAQRSSLSWEEEHYNHADEYIWCSQCGKMLDIYRQTPAISVDESTQVTTYTVERQTDHVKETRSVEPFTVVLKPGISGLEGIQELHRIAHRRGDGADFLLPSASPWPIEGYQFDSWLFDDQKIAEVHFDRDDGSKIIVGGWKVSITYDANVLLPEDFTVIGYAPQEPNPSWVLPGLPHTLLPCTWEQYFAGVDGKGTPIKSFYVFDGWDVSVGIKFTDKFTIEYIWETVTDLPGKMPGTVIGPVVFPTMIRARWRSPWKIMGNALNGIGNYALPDNTYATQLDTTMTIKGGSESELDLNGHKAHAWFLSAALNPITVEGKLLVKDSSEGKNGCISGGKSVVDGVGVKVHDKGHFILESGNILENTSYNNPAISPPNGGGVMVNGVFDMKGGSVRDNTCHGNGGGVCIGSSGSFQMTGGEITGNKARYDYPHGTLQGGTGQGGGVYVGGSFSVSGKVVVKNNTVDGKANNVYLPNGKTIAVIEKLDEQAEIHVSMETPGVFTSGLKANAGDEAWGSAANFVSDDPNYEVVINADGEAALRKKAPKFDKTELELGGVLKLRFYMDCPEGWDPTGDRMAFNVNGVKTRTVYYDASAEGDGKDYFACPVNAYQMADTITAVYYHGNEKLAEKQCSVRQYLEKLVDPQTEGVTDAARKLAQATMNYGHYIQPYLANANNWTVDRDHTAMPAYSELTPSEIPDDKYGYDFNKTGGYSAYVKKTEFYLTLDAGTELNVRVYLKNGGVVTGTANGAPVEPFSRSGSSWVLRMPNLPSNGLDIPIPFTCSVDGHEVFELRISALSFVKTVLAMSDSSDPTETAAMTALYQYAMEAKEYKSE